MNGNAQKTPIFQSANRVAQKRALDAIQLTGKGLPCRVVSSNNSIVTVSFQLNTDFTLPNVTIPIYGCEYIRYPKLSLNGGAKGAAIALDARLSGVSGIGGGTADLSQPANLTALVFLPISNTAWSSVDENALTMYAPNGVVLRDQESQSVITLTPTGIVCTGRDGISLTSGTSTVVLNNDGSWSISGSGAAAISANGLTISDGAQNTTLPHMSSAWDALVSWLNGHTHPTPSGESSPPSTPFSGENIIL